MYNKMENCIGKDKIKEMTEEEKNLIKELLEFIPEEKNNEDILKRLLDNIEKHGQVCDGSEKLVHAYENKRDLSKSIIKKLG